MQQDAPGSFDCVGIVLRKELELPSRDLAHLRSRLPLLSLGPIIVEMVHGFFGKKDNDSLYRFFEREICKHVFEDFAKFEFKGHVARLF